MSEKEVLKEGSEVDQAADLKADIDSKDQQADVDSKDQQADCGKIDSNTQQANCGITFTIIMMIIICLLQQPLVSTANIYFKNVICLNFL